MPIHDWTAVPAGIFHDFHQDWTVCLKHALNGGILPPEYYALVEQTSAGRYPDVLTFEVARPSGATDGNGRSASPSNGGVLTLAESPPRVAITATIESDVFAQKSNRVVVFDDVDEVVSVIEIVSPGNKSSRYRFDAIVEKVSQFLRDGVHVLMIDLFPTTSRDPHGMHAAVWARMTDYDFRLPEGKSSTIASYSAGAIKRAFVEAVAIGDSVPEMPLFLEPERYVNLPLDATYRTTFAAVPPRWRDKLSA